MRQAVFQRCFGSDGRVEAIRAMACLVDGCPNPPMNAHIRARGRGGAKGTYRQVVPLCAVHDAEAGEMPGPGHWEGSKRQAFQIEHGIDLERSAKRIARDLDKLLGLMSCHSCGALGKHSLMCKTIEALQERREENGQCSSEEK